MTENTASTADRIRLITAEVDLQIGPEMVTQRVSLRFPWTGPQPDHSCRTINCSSCRQQAFKKAAAKVSGDPMAFRVLRDGQSTR